MKRSTRQQRAHEVQQLSPEERAQHALDAQVFKIEKSILRELAPLQRQVLATARQLVAERLAPVSRSAAKEFLYCVRVRDLP
jgi:hypothetical protein